MKKIVLLGPGPQFKGGIANYNTSLARALERTGKCDVHIVSWTHQYPAFIPRDFIDRKSKTNQLAGTTIKVDSLLNYNNPFSWYKTIRFIKKLNPDAVIIQWSISLQGLPIGVIVNQLKRAGIRVGLELHNVKQKENSAIDKMFTIMGIRNVDFYISHGMLTIRELQQIFPKQRYDIVSPSMQSSGKGKLILELYHPVYDMFKPDPAFDIEALKKKLGLRKHVFLFFGFIRKYKGLHYAIRAFAQLAAKRNDVSLLIVGESFWHTLDKTKLSSRIKSFVFSIVKGIFLPSRQDERSYKPLDLINDYNISDQVVVVNEFVPNEEVHRYFQVSDYLLLFYTYSTPSGVESIAYNFNVPILATNVGNFPDTIHYGYNGYLAEADNIFSMAEIMQKAIEHPIDRGNVQKSASEMSWDNYANAIVDKILI